MTKFIFISENKCEYLSVPDSAYTWQIPIPPPPARVVFEPKGEFSPAMLVKIETYRRRTVVLHDKRFDVFCQDGLQDENMLQKIEKFLNERIRI